MTPPFQAGAFWAADVAVLFNRVGSSPAGLDSAAARERLRTCGDNVTGKERRSSIARLLLSQFRNPLLLLLLLAASLAMLSGEWVDAWIVMLIVIATSGISFSREVSAHKAIAALQKRVQLQSRVLRDGREILIPSREIVPGDVVLLSAGSLVPADVRILEANHFHVSESVLTGESFPVEKRPGILPPDTRMARRHNCSFMGTNVRSGFARCLVVSTGISTELGVISRRLAMRSPATEFERGIRRFGYLLLISMLVLVLVVFVAHMLRHRAPLETLLFTLALAVGLSPELLPAILAVNLSRGAQDLAAHGVLVRRLNAIENLGSMDVLCCDKTGTLTEGVVKLEKSFDPEGRSSPEPLRLAAINAALETGLANPLDDAIRDRSPADLRDIKKIGEIPFDFVARRISVVVEKEGRIEIISKGAFAPVLEICSETASGRALDETARAELNRRFDVWSGQGMRLLAVASGAAARKGSYSRDDEKDLRLVGFIGFSDNLKPGVLDAIRNLEAQGVSLKLISGDHHSVVRHVAAQIGLMELSVQTGRDLERLHDDALGQVLERTQVFAEVDPNQKERIIRGLRRAGHVVGFLGDGVNDAPAMHAADTSLSVEHGVDVAREAADFVLLQKDLHVIRKGIEEGRRTFANSLKYILLTTSANVGNMISMAAASLFLPFLPLTAGQILLNNFLSDIPALGLAGDHVDREMTSKPKRWDIRFIGRFMVEFGLLSTAFDCVTFAVLLFAFRASPEEFRTAWFVESLLTELFIIFVVRTQRRMFESRPGRFLLLSACSLAVAAPFMPYAAPFRLLGFVPLPLPLLTALFGITALYVASAEWTKEWFYRHIR